MLTIIPEKMLILNKNGNPLTVIWSDRGEGGDLKGHALKSRILTDRNFVGMEEDKRVTFRGSTSATRLSFENDKGERTNVWVTQAVTAIKIEAYAGVAPGTVLTAVSAIADINVANGTVLGDVGLPTHVEATISGDIKVFLPVVWDGGTPVYNGAVAATYAFDGTITMPTGLTNPESLVAEVNVIVAAA